MRPFDVLRFCAYLFGIVVLLIMLETLLALTVCTWSIAAGRTEMGGCQNMGNALRDIFAELLAGIFALIAASRPGPPGPPKT